jgi:hypothetical protein
MSAAPDLPGDLLALAREDLVAAEALEERSEFRMHPWASMLSRPLRRR